MKYVLYKFVEAETAAAAIAKDASTPVHEVSLKAGEQSLPDGGNVSAIGFCLPSMDRYDEAARKRR